MEWEPTESDAVCSVATPGASRGAVPSSVEPSKNWTDPCGVPVMADVTVAVKVMEAPKSALGLELASAVALAAGLIVTVNTVETDPATRESPAYRAVMLRVPPPRSDVVREAEPPIKGTAPEMGVVPSKKDMLPVAVAGVTVAVKISELPN